MTPMQRKWEHDDNMRRHEREIARNHARQEALRRRFPWDWLAEIGAIYRRR